MRTRRNLLTASIVLVSLGLAACASGDAGGTGSVDPAKWQDAVKGGKIEVGVQEPVDDPSYKLRTDLVAQLEKDIPGAKVTLTFANSLARPALEQRWRGGNGPDVDFSMFDGTSENTRVWADDGFLLDLRPYLEKTKLKSGERWIDSFTPGALGFMEDPESKAIYGVPTELSAQILFYNAKMFRDLNITPPTTWEELLAACDKLKAAGTDPIAVTGLFLPYLAMWTDNIWNRTVPYDEATAVLSQGKGHITDNPGFLEGLKDFEALARGGNFAKGFESTDFAPAEALFFQGKAGMIMNGNWLAGSVATSAPEGFELGALAFPTIKGGAGDQKSVLATAQLVSVNAKSKNIPLALEWLLRNTDAKTQERGATEFGKLASVNGVPGPVNGEGIEKVLADADILQPREFGMSGTDAYDLVHGEIAKLAFGEQDAETTLQRLDEGLRKVYKN